MSKIAFNEIQFPSDIAYGACGGPEFLTDIVTSSSGFEQRNINWVQARNRYNLAPAIKNKEQLEALISFFRLSYGKAVGFRFKDWTDYQIKKQVIAMADGKTSNFQAIKKYSYGGYQVTKKILKLVDKTVKIYCDGILVNPEVDLNSGGIKFDSSPAKNTIISIEAEFDVPVRFNTDHLSNSIEQYDVYSHQEISLIELKI
jgi:uncharacterized protein (TIGR02217 family)